MRNNIIIAWFQGLNFAESSNMVQEVPVALLQYFASLDYLLRSRQLGWAPTEQQGFASNHAF